MVLVVAIGGVFWVLGILIFLKCKSGLEITKSLLSEWLIMQNQFTTISRFSQQVPKELPFQILNHMLKTEQTKAMSPATYDLELVRGFINFFDNKIATIRSELDSLSVHPLESDPCHTLNCELQEFTPGGIGDIHAIMGMWKGKG